MCIVCKRNVVLTRLPFQKSDRHPCYFQYAKKVDFRSDTGGNNRQQVGLYRLEIKLFLPQKVPFLLIGRNANGILYNEYRCTRVGLFVIEFKCNFDTFSPILFRVSFQNNYLRALLAIINLKKVWESRQQVYLDVEFYLIGLKSSKLRPVIGKKPLSHWLSKI